MPHRISPADDTTLTETRRGRAWIDQAGGVGIGYTLAGTSPGTSKTLLLIHGAPQTGQRVAQGRAKPGGGRLPSRRARLPRRRCFHQAP